MTLRWVGRLGCFFVLALGAGCGESSPSDDTGGAGGSASSGGGGGASGSASGAASDTLCGERPGGKLWGKHVLRFESPGGSTVVQFRRVNDGVGVGESLLFHAESFGLVRDGETECLQGDSLGYTNSHHNWADVVEAEGEARYRLEFLFGVSDAGLSYRFSALSSAGAPLYEETVIPTGGPPFCYACPGGAGVSVSEFAPNNASTLADEAGEFEPWIELFNPSSEGVDLTGYALSNDFLDRRRWALPSMTLGGHETLIVFADAEAEEGPLHANFRLSAQGGELVLTRPTGVTDGGIFYEASDTDESFAFDWTAADYLSTDEPRPGEPPPE